MIFDGLKESSNNMGHVLIETKVNDQTFDWRQNGV